MFHSVIVAHLNSCSRGTIENVQSRFHEYIHRKNIETALRQWEIDWCREPKPGPITLHFFFFDFVENLEMTCENTKPYMATVFHTWINGRFVDIKDWLRLVKPSGATDGTKFPCSNIFSVVGLSQFSAGLETNKAQRGSFVELSANHTVRSQRCYSMLSKWQKFRFRFIEIHKPFYFLHQSITDWSSFSWPTARLTLPTLPDILLKLK